MHRETLSLQMSKETGKLVWMVGLLKSVKVEFNAANFFNKSKDDHETDFNLLWTLKLKGLSMTENELNE